MSITDYSPINSTLRQDAGRFLRSVVRAFTPRIMQPQKQATEQDLQNSMADAMARLRMQVQSPVPPPVRGAGWNYPPMLRTDDEQAQVWASEDAKYGRATTQAGPTLQAYATQTMDMSIERIAAWHWQQMQQGVCQFKADLDAATMREDGHLQASQRSIAALAYKSPLQFKPRGESDLAKGLCAFVEASLSRCTNLEKAQETLFMSAATGHSALEVVWQTPRPITFPVGKTLITAQNAKGVASLEEVHNRNFRIDPATRAVYLDTGGARFVDPFVSPSGNLTRKLIYHNGYGHGDGHQHGYQYASNPLCLFKKLGLSRFMVALELFGVQVPYMQIDEAGYGDGRFMAAAQAFVDAIGLGKPAVLAQKMGEVKVTPPATGLDARGMHFALFGLINAELSKLSSGSTLTMEIGGVGSYGASETHADSKEDVGRIHDRLTCKTLEVSLVLWIVEENLDALCACLGATPDQILACVPVVFRMLDRRIDPVARLKMFIDARERMGIIVDPAQIAEECAFRVVGHVEPVQRAQGAPAGAAGADPAQDGADPALPQE